MYLVTNFDSHLFGCWGLETTQRLNQFSHQFGVVKPKKEIHTQSRYQGIFLQFRQIFVIDGPMRFELVAVAVGPRTALWGLIPGNVVIAIPGLLFQRGPWRWLSWLDEFQSRVMSSLLARQTGRINRRVVEVGEFQKATKPITDFVCQGATWVECQLGRVNNTSNLLKLNWHVFTETSLSLRRRRIF